MSWQKTDWINIVGTDAFKSTINAGGFATVDVDCSGQKTFMKLSIKVVIVFGASTNNPVDIEIYGIDANSANEADSLPIWKQTIDQFPSFERRITISNLDVSSLDSIRIIARNKDTGHTVNIWMTYCAGYFA